MEAELGRLKRRVSTLVSSGLGSLYSIGLLFPQAVQDLVQFPGGDKMVKIVVYLDGRRPRAGPHALHFFERDLAVRGGFLVTDSELLAGVLPKLVAIPEEATDVGADLDVVLSQRLLVQHGVVRQHFVDLERGHADTLGH